MNTLQILLLVIVSLSGIPAGMLISKYAKEELKDGKKWFVVIMAASAVLLLISALADFSQKPLALTALGFAFLLALTSLKKAG